MFPRPTPRFPGLLALGLGLTLLSADPARAQAEDPAAARYYDFWPGTWAEVVDGEPDTTATTFTVRRGVRPTAFVESWRLVYEGAVHRSAALRAWDREAGRWRFAWTDDDARFQVWEGVEVGGDWYIVRRFEIDGRAFLSRQAWIPTGTDALVRVMERSFDGGRTWETRSRTDFARVARAIEVDPGIGPAGDDHGGKGGPVGGDRREAREFPGDALPLHVGRGDQQRGPDAPGRPPAGPVDDGEASQRATAPSRSVATRRIQGDREAPRRPAYLPPSGRSSRSQARRATS